MHESELHRAVAHVDDLYLPTMLGCAHEQKAQGVWFIGVANKNAILRALPNNSNHNGVSFLTDLLCLRVTQMINLNLW